MSDEISDEARAAAREAVVRQQHELFRAAQRAVGVEPVAYDQLSDRTKRLKHQQLDGLADAALAAALPVDRSIREAVRDLLWKATQFGETEDGDTAAYLVPKGAVHRLVGAMQGAGESASLRVSTPASADVLLMQMRAAAVDCCDAGRTAYPDPCPWHPTAT